MIFHDPIFGRHIDVFFNSLDFCHNINFVGRLEKEEITLPLAELILEKMQIVQINEKDIIDTVMLLREHPIGDVNSETVNAKVITQTLCNDWGWWRTVTMNFKVVEDQLAMYSDLTEEDRSIVLRRLNELRQRSIQRQNR